jgi:O-antigen ligase
LANADPNGHSLLQRLEYWRTSLKIIQQNWLFGVGTGDLQMAFDEQYEQDNSKLNKENRLRAHNTYLTVWITFGVLSLLFFFLIVKYFLAMIKYENYLGLAFITIAIVTFFIEDTLETQTGVTFFSFFYGLFLGKKIE